MFSQVNLNRLFLSRDSFNSLQNWLTDARNLASPNIVIILVGNKKDLENQREVTYQEASQFAIDNGNISILDIFNPSDHLICS